MDVTGLFDACDDAASARRTSWWVLRRPAVLWLTGPAVQVGGRTWRSHHHGQRDGHAVHGFSARQCAQIRDALRPVLASREQSIMPYLSHLC